MDTKWAIGVEPVASEAALLEVFAEAEAEAVVGVGVVEAAGALQVAVAETRRYQCRRPSCHPLRCQNCWNNASYETHEKNVTNGQEPERRGEKVRSQGAAC
jgi:hypothetical protein